MCQIWGENIGNSVLNIASFECIEFCLLDFQMEMLRRQLNIKSGV